MQSGEWIISVGELNEYVRKTLAGDPMLRGIRLRGEISNFKRHVSGHWYFTVKDEMSAINCAMFRQAAGGVRFAPRDGMRVILLGSVGLYAKTGAYQFYADGMLEDGVGDLYLKFEALKKKLASEGLFDPSVKKPLPLFPSRIGVITSGTGAVLHDICSVARRRSGAASICLLPVKVQGEGAADEIARALRVMDGLPGIDVIIVGRGGGSIEDLWAFNEETVARAIFACVRPVISAVGHETDFTIADFVADVRAPTPSAAAELAVPEASAVSQSVRLLTERLLRAVQARCAVEAARISDALRALCAMEPKRLLDDISHRYGMLLGRMNAAVNMGLSLKERELERRTLRLSAVGPEETLRRGYALVVKDGRPLGSVASASAGDDITVIMSTGEIEARVTKALPKTIEREME